MQMLSPNSDTCLIWCRVIVQKKCSTYSAYVAYEEDATAAAYGGGVKRPPTDDSGLYSGEHAFQKSTSTFAIAKNKN